MRLDQLDDPSPPTFGPAQLATVLDLAESHRRHRRHRRQRATLIASGVAVVMLASVSIVTIVGGDDHASAPPGSAPQWQFTSPHGRPTSVIPPDGPGGIAVDYTEPGHVAHIWPTSPASPTANATVGAVFTSAGGTIRCQFIEHGIACRPDVSLAAGADGIDRRCTPAKSFVVMSVGGSPQIRCSITNPLATAALDTTTFTPIRMALDSLVCSSTPARVTCRDSVSQAGFVLHQGIYEHFPR
jgi:hypothetical protein